MKNGDKVRVNAKLLEDFKLNESSYVHELLAADTMKLVYTDNDNSALVQVKKKYSDYNLHDGSHCLKVGQKAGKKNRCWFVNKRFLEVVKKCK